MSENNGKHGKELDAALGHLPALMAELTKEFIEKKDLNTRVQIRCRMRALLDLAFVDTIWPGNAMKKDPSPARDMAMNDQGMGCAPAMTVAPSAYMPAVQPVPGAGRAEDNSI